MIKRRFYRTEHGDRDDASDSSISSSDCEPEADATEESGDDVEEVDEDDIEEVNEDDVEEVNEDDASCSTSSGYASEDSSVNEVDVDSSGLPSHEDDGKERHTLIESHLPGKNILGAAEPQSDIASEKESLPTDISTRVLKCKSVFKCRICPRVVCLNEETLQSHLKSKRHSRSEKLLKEGRLKIMLNINGEIENPENITDSPPRVPAFPPENRRRRNKSQPRFGQQPKRSNKEGKRHSNHRIRQSSKSEVKKRRKIE